MDFKVSQASRGTATAEVATLTHEGREFTALGSMVDHDAGRVCGYVVERDGREELQTFGGAKLGELRRVSRRLMWSFGRSLYFTFYRATVDGREYHGRMGGETMLLRLRSCR